MALSLKERYGKRQMQQLQERAREADTQLLQEAKFVALLVETMSEEDLNKVGAIVDKLDTMKNPALPTLTQAIETAQAELNKYTGGGNIVQAWTKLKTMVGIDNPVVKITTFADTLERGLSQVSTILKNNGVNLGKFGKDDQRLNQSLSNLLADPNTGAKTDTQMGRSPVTGEDVPDKEEPAAAVPKPVPGQERPIPGAAPEEKNPDYAGNVRAAAGLPKTGTKSGTKPSTPQKPSEPKHTGGQQPPPKPNKKPLNTTKGGVGEGVSELDEADKTSLNKQKVQNITAQLKKAFSPGGLFGAFKKSPYIDINVLIKEFMAAPLRVFAQTAQRASQGAKAAEIAPDMKDQVQGQGANQTKHSTGTQPAKPGTAGEPQPSSPSKPTTEPTGNAPAGQQPVPKPGHTRGGGSEATYTKAKTKLAQLFKALPKDMDNVVKKLVDAGFNPDSL
jgi:hypothetical protein